MLTQLLKSKLHHAVVTETNPEYHGSITIDADLLEASGLLPNEAVTIADCANGNRFETYVILGKRGSGVIGINGAAALLTSIGNRVIVMSYVLVEPHEVRKHKSRVVVCNTFNRVAEIISAPSHL